MALGARPSGVVRRIVWRGLRPIVVGAVLGVAASYALSRVLANQLWGVTVADPWTFSGAVIALLAVGVAACIWPARRATRIDPVTALRYE